MTVSVILLSSFGVGKQNEDTIDRTRFRDHVMHLIAIWRA